MNDGGQAFPHREYESRPFYHGMSLRDWFAGQALAGLIASDDNDACTSRDPDGIRKEIQAHADNYATAAYRYADAMLEARRTQAISAPGGESKDRANGTES